MRNSSQASKELKAYRAILQLEPGAKSPAFDVLLETEARGDLPGFIASASASCSARDQASATP